MEPKIAQGTYDFRIMREKGYRYVDKTALLYPLVTRDGDGFFFISRPRRFGKSLMLSTLKCIFQGRRDLFKGLAIDQMDYDWNSYPIISFDFFPVETSSFELFKEDLRTTVKRALAEAGADWDESVSTHLNFAAAIDQLAAANEHGQVVVLIDEYGMTRRWATPCRTSRRPPPSASNSPTSMPSSSRTPPKSAS